MRLSRWLIITVHYAIGAFAVIYTFRFSKKNMILGGLWCSREKPLMNTFLKPLIDCFNDLFMNGKCTFNIGIAVCMTKLVPSLGVEVLTVCGTKLIKAAMVVITCDLYLQEP